MPLPKIFSSVLGLALVLFFFGSFTVVLASPSDNLSGWAWIDPETVLPADAEETNFDIGWISFNCTDRGNCASSNYGVRVASDGSISGYAWSENLGWLSFRDGDGSHPNPVLNRTTGEVSGWAKFLSADNKGWDGWVHLNGSGYGVSVAGCDWSGYVWGSDVVGWIKFGGSNYGVVGTGDACVIGPTPTPSVTITPTPSVTATPTPTPTPAVCGDGVINGTEVCDAGSGGNGLCPKVCNSTCSEFNICGPCNDGIDNDGDGVVFIDMDDPACVRSGGTTEYSACNDKNPDGTLRDNDGDGVANIFDPGCHSDGNPNNPATYDPNDNNESNMIIIEVFGPIRRLIAMLFSLL